MSKKDFSKVADAIAEATAEPAAAEEAQEKPKAQKTRKARKTYSAQEAQEFLENGQTAGRKGVRLPRINLAFQPELYDYVKTMAHAAGISYTDFLNRIIQEHKAKHADVYEKAIEFRDSL